MGWAASAILLITLAWQVRVQAKERRTEGVSVWLFVGQIAASVGFIVYSVLVGDTVFIVSNACILLTAIIGQCVLMRNRRHAKPGAALTGDRNGGPPP